MIFKEQHYYILCQHITKSYGESTIYIKILCTLTTQHGDCTQFVERFQTVQHNII